MSEIIHSTYEILEKIGFGGGGNVYLANHINLNKKVVLKADKRKITTKLETLRREVDVMKNLNHTYIPQVYDFFIENNVVYTAIDYVSGESLDKPLKRGEKFSQPQIIKWAVQLLEALEYLHSPIHGDPPKGYVHSDIKPANLMRTPDNNICLIDFNIALALGELNSIGRSIGYSSPEHYGIDYSTGGSEDYYVSETIADMSSSPSQNKQAVEYDKKTLLDCTGTQIDNIIPESIQEKTVLEDNQSEPASKILLSDSKSQKAFVSSETKIDSEITLKSKIKKTEIQNTTGKTVSIRKKIMPDIRSDIYMVGATLYHLLSGNKPTKDAKDVIPLSCVDFSSQIVEIISKAMNPNPDLRYQTAAEMLNAFRNLGICDKRVIRFKRHNKIVLSIMSAMLIAGVFISFTGLKRMQTSSYWKNLISLSDKALQNGDKEKAVQYALEAIPTKKGIFTPERPTDAQLALTNAIGIYDLADGYKAYKTFNLPSEPLFIEISPNGKTAACICLNKLLIIDTETCKTIETLTTVDSALAEVAYVDDDNIIYAGENGIEKYNISTRSKVWNGDKATAIALSANNEIVAAVYRDEIYAVIYNAGTGEVIHKVDFNDKKQSVVVNDCFANPNDNLFSLNNDGTLLATSFSDGSLMLFDLLSEDNDVELLEANMGYSHFEGGFYRNYFAFSAYSNDNSIFTVIDTDNMEQTGGFQSSSSFGVDADESGIKVQTDDILVKINPQTGEQQPLVNLSEPIWSFIDNGVNALVSTKTNIMFFNENAYKISSYKSNSRADILALSDDVAIVGSLDSSQIQIFRYKDFTEYNLTDYEADYKHNETRVSLDWKNLMMFSYDSFRIYDMNGNIVADVQIPDAEFVNDQQFVRSNDNSYLEVTYNNGKAVDYDARSGSIIGEFNGTPPNSTLYEEFDTESYHITNPLHGVQEVYDINSGQYISSFNENAYMTYATQVQEMLIVQYINAEGYCYGKIYNDNLEEIAELPHLCDIIDEKLIFDYPSGVVCFSPIYSLEQLLDISKS